MIKERTINIFHAGSWDDLFKVVVALYIIGTVVWNVFSTGEKVLDYKIVIKDRTQRRKAALYTSTEC